ncbi:MAG TPA: SRPBCC domain-containing protein [Chromatiales bacterium]|nr:SRPBCC domain-containing protein [Thiotrichales bacterium]HIP69012.1 SRPBCC domain-containing protein [Chromatiales bacterium]
MTDLIVNVTKIIHARIERVFDAWLNPETLSQFILPMPGMPQPQVETDAREGGEFKIIMQVGDDKIPHTGRYIEINRPNKLVFTWVSPFSADGSTVTLKFTDIGENRTNIDLTHIKFIDEEHRENHEGGWSNILESLNDILG